MKRKNLARITAFTLAIMLVLGGFLAKYAGEAVAYRRVERAVHFAAMSQLSSSISKISASLTKVMYASSPEILATASSEIWLNSASATAALAQLPISDISIDNTKMFISRAGDFASYIARKAAMHEPLLPDERETVSVLASAARDLSEQVLTLEADIYSGSATFMKNAKKQTAALDQFRDMESNFPQNISLIYDGSMSQHMQNRASAMIEAAKPCGMEECAKIAATALGVEPGNLRHDGDSEAAIPTYTFRASTGWAEVSKNGGYLVSLRSDDEELTDESGEAGEGMDYTIAVEKARVFLTDQGYSGMEPVYGLTEGSITLISFAWKTGGVTVYPDLIRVGVSADTGKIVRFDALAYLMSHRPREIKGAVVSDADAAREFSPDLTVRYVGQVIIPTPGLYEVQCHEFDCIAPDGQRMMIYSDVATGRARQILLRYDGDNGTLTV